MNFLSTFFLTLLPLVSIPLIIHLLNKRNVKTINFSSIRFLKALETESIKRLQFLQMFLMALRTLIILLIILMMSRPVVGGMFSLWDNDDSIITAIIIDDTFSNMGVENNTERLNLIKKAYLEVKTQISDKSQIHVSTITDGVIFNGIKKDIPDIDKILDVSYDTGSLTSIILKINDEYKDDSAVKDLYLITDGQMQIFDDISVLDKILFNWNKFIIKLPEIKNNLSITNVNILNEIILPNIPIDIEVTISNNGSIDVKNHLLQLFINDINVGQQLITINKKTTSIFNFKTILTDTKFHECYAMLDKDDRIEDNNYYFTINIPETLKIGTINSSNSIYMANLFKSINYDNSTIITKNYSFDGISKAISDRNDILIINGYHIFDNYGPIALNYVGNGGHLILFPDNTDSLSTPLEIFDTLYQDKSIYHLSDDSYQTSKLVNNFNNFFISDSIYDSTIKLFKFFKVPQSSNSIVISKDSYSIFNRYFEGDGIVDIFTISPTLNWSNFPIKASFIPFFHKIVYSKFGSAKLLSLNINDKWLIDDEVKRGHTEIMYLSPNQNLTPIDITQKEIGFDKIVGFHRIKSKNGDIISSTSINVPVVELKEEILSEKQLTKIFNTGKTSVIVLDDDKVSIQDSINSIRSGSELWRYILYLITLLLIIEMIVSNNAIRKTK